MKCMQIMYKGMKTDYDIYTNGDVYSHKTKKFLKRSSGPSVEYPTVTLYINTIPHIVKVHRLVAEAFIPNDDPDHKIEVNHKDGNKYNPDISNLEWVTKSENILHAFRTGLKHSKIGSNSPVSIYSDNIIKDVCVYLEEGLLTLKEISKITNVGFTTIFMIATKKARTEISCNYKVENYYHDRESYSYDQYKKVFQYLSENKYSLYEISDITNVRYSSIGNILSHKENPIYNDLFKTYNIDNYKGGYIPYKKLSEDIIKYTILLYNQGMKPKYIKRIVSKRYDINEEKIRVFIRDYKKSSTTIESIA